MKKFPHKNLLFLYYFMAKSAFHFELMRYFSRFFMGYLINLKILEHFINYLILIKQSINRELNSLKNNCNFKQLDIYHTAVIWKIPRIFMNFVQNRSKKLINRILNHIHLIIIPKL